MLPALRALPKHHRPLIPSRPLTTSFGRKTLSVRFQQAEPVSTQPDHNQDNMDETHMHHDKTTTITEDIMSHSFEVAYATRSEEEGFGGIIYGGNQTETETKKEEEEEEFVHENHPEYDKKQGSEVEEKEKEKEKGRHQTHTE